jgi:hypothetical protein
MPIFRVNNYIDAYRLRAQSDDVHELAARPDKKTLTAFVNRQIFDAIQPGPDDFLVDIGCGDASLVRMAQAQTPKCTGTVSSVEEEQKLKATFPGLSVVTCEMQSLPFDPGSVSKVVCNAALMYLPGENDVKAALREIARIARPGATIWVGEIPEIDEYAYYGSYRGASMSGLLWHILKHNGLRAFLGMVRRWARAVFGDERIVLNSAGIFYAGPEEMVAMAESCGLRLKTYFRHKELDREGKAVDSQFRYDYIFTI